MSRIGGYDMLLATHIRKNEKFVVLIENPKEGH
jgi:hypothetical protein